MSKVNRSSLRRATLVGFLLASSLTAPTAVGAQRGGGGGGPVLNTPAPPRFQYVGPAPAGRIASVAGVPGDTLTYYFGAASGGIWKTTDGARTFTPIFDDQPVQAIGALAVSRTNPRVIYAGTGEAWAIRDADVMGDGVYKSTDAGATWANVGLKETGRIGKIIIHPTNPNIVYVCALGRATGPQQERGVYRTLDGGATWTRVLFVNENTGCSGVNISIEDPSVLIAGMWEVVMHTWAMFSGGNSSGVYISRDSGSTWKLATAGMPKSPVGKVDVAIAPSNGKRMYALIQTADQGSVWRSDDGGLQWKVVSWDRSLIGRAGYYIRIDVNPQNDLEVLVANSSFHRSLDGGETFPITGGGCGDCHDIWLDPRNPSHWVATGDGGAGITRNHGQTFTQYVLPIGQMYHVAIDDQVPYWLYSNRQDDGTMRGPNNQPVPITNVVMPQPGSGGAAQPPGEGGGGGGGGGRGGGGANVWQADIGGCESGFTLPTPKNPDIIWATCYGNKVTRFDAKTGSARSVSPWMHTLDAEPNKLKYRCHWTAPLAIDPFDTKTVYYGCQVIFKTANDGQTWSVISPDLSTQDPSRVVSSGGVIGDNLGQFYGEVVFAIAPSEMQRGLIWAGTNDGKVWNTIDGGVKWNDVTKNITGMPTWGTVRKIEPSRFDPQTAYVVVDFHMMDDRKPYIYKTTDLGKTWKRISDGLPQTHPLDYAMSLAENPNRKGMLFVGTGHAFYYSLDDGAKWTQYQNGLPAAPVTWVVASKLNHDVVLSTYGRGLYVLRDISIIEQSDRVVADAPLQFFEPRTGVRAPRAGSIDLTFTLKAAPRDTLVMEIVDSTGTVVRTLRANGRAGNNRVTWDLRYDGPKQVELRTTPPDNPRIWDEPRFKNRDTRPIVHWGIQGPQRTGPIAAPGKYTLRVRADGQQYTQMFSIMKDPKIAATDADLVLSTKAQARILSAINATVETVNSLEIMRKQIEDLLKADTTSASAKTALRDLDKKMYDVELQLLSKSDLHSDDKWYVEQYRVYLNLLWLMGEIGTGASDMAGGAEFRPTDASMTTLGEIERDLGAAKTGFAALIEKDLPAFNKLMGGRIVISDKLPIKKPVILP